MTSRDLTPKELLAFERANINSGGPSILDTMRNTTVSYNGSKTPYCTQEELAHREQFPLLGKLLNRFEPLYNTLSDTPGGLDLLTQKEKDLEVYVNTGEGDKDSPVILWFEGKLDKSFYYSETNEARLLSSVQGEAAVLGVPDIHQLAADIDQFTYGIDTYEYNDRVEDREQQVLEIEGWIRSGETDAIVNYLSEILDEYEYYDDEAIAGRALLARLNKAISAAQEQGAEKPGLDSIISNAEQRRPGVSQDSKTPTDRDR